MDSKSLLAALVFATLFACNQETPIGLSSDSGPQNQNDAAPPADAGFPDVSSADASPADISQPDSAPIDSGIPPGPSCNTDSECGAMTYCHANFSARVGRCLPCPIADVLPCARGVTNVLEYGNGCGQPICDCPADKILYPSGDCSIGTNPWLHLAPDTLQFFWLPIGSARLAVSGLDRSANMCATLIWDFSNNGQRDGAHCDDFVSTFPYVVVEPPSAIGGCGAWDYQGNVTTETATGCIDSADFPDPSANVVDAVVSTRGPAFTGRIAVNNRRETQPWPVNIVFEYSTDTEGEHLYVQSKDFNGELGWVRIIADGAPLAIDDRCDEPICGEPQVQCPINAAETIDIITPNTFGGKISATWDGLLRVMPTANVCRERQPAYPRTYEAEVCYSHRTADTGQGSILLNPICTRTSFVHPGTDQVVISVNEGG